jgi:hypothetical protein
MRAYGSTGTGLFSSVSITGFIALDSRGFGITSNSSNNIIIVGPSSSNNTGQYVIYNSSGSVVVSLTTFTTTQGYASSVLTQFDATTLSDGSTVIFGFSNYDTSNSNYQPMFKICPTTASTITIGSDFYIPIANIQNGYGIYGNAFSNLTVASLSFGGFILLATGNAYSAINSGYSLGYAVFNSSGVCVSGFGSSGLGTNAGWHVIGDQQLNGVLYKSGIVEITSTNTIYIYNSYDGFALHYNQLAIPISNSTWVTSPQLSLNGAWGSASATPTTANLSASAPNKISFNGPGGAGSTTFSPGTIVAGPTFVGGTTANAGYYVLSSATFPNGNFAILYININNSILSFNIYSPTGVFIQTVNTGIPQYLFSIYTTNAKIVILPSGKVAIAYYTNNTTNSISVVLFTSSFVQINSVNLSAGMYQGNVQANFGFAALADDKVLITFTDNGTNTNTNIYVYDNTLTLYYNTVASLAGGGPALMNSASGTSDGGFWIFVYQGSGYWAQYYQNIGGSYTSSGGTQINSGVTNFGGSSSIASMSGALYFMGLSSSLYKLFAVGQDLTDYQITGTSVSTSNYGYISGTGAVIGMTGMGTPVGVFSNTSGSGSISILPTTASTTSAFAPTLYNLPSAITNTSNSMISVTPGVGYNIVISYLTYNSTVGYYAPYFVIVNAAPTRVSYPQYPVQWVPTSTSTASSGVPVIPTPTATTPSITGVFSGVAVTSASAGSTGQVAINGLAQLNSNYSSSATGAFDYTGQAVDGVKGTYNGRTVTLQGNS